MQVATSAPISTNFAAVVQHHSGKPKKDPKNKRRAVRFKYLAAGLRHCPASGTAGVPHAESGARTNSDVPAAGARDTHWVVPAVVAMLVHTPAYKLSRNSHNSPNHDSFCVDIFLDIKLLDPGGALKRGL